MGRRSPSAGRSKWGQDLVLYLIFSVTGAAVVLPGNILPLLLARWRISDERAGLFFLLFFIASTVGAILSRGSLTRSIARGCILAAFGLGSLVFASGTTALVSFALYGLGLGITMTSISLRQARQYPERRTAEMTRLNLIWAVGACFGPFIALRGIALVGLRCLLFGIAAFLALVCPVTLGFVRSSVGAPVPGERVSSYGFATPMLLLLMVPIATGIEAATGGWLTTYVSRSGDALGATISTVTCFWIGMLASRGIQSIHSVAVAIGQLVLTICPLGIIAGLVLVLNAPAGASGAVGALLIGAGVGPMYPFLVARCLGHSESGNLVFVLGGSGAALFPWIAGLLSSASGSLRLGLLSLLATAVLMEFLGVLSKVRRI